MGPENGVPPSQIRIFQDGDAVYLLRLTTKRLYVARWNGENAFEEIVMNELQGIDYPIASFDCIRRNKRDLGGDSLSRRTVLPSRNLQGETGSPITTEPGSIGVPCTARGCSV